jgi:hypothetical protein
MQLHNGCVIAQLFRCERPAISRVTLMRFDEAAKANIGQFLNEGYGPVVELVGHYPQELLVELQLVWDSPEGFDEEADADARELMSLLVDEWP